ncbi:germinal-center associated nuclear protein-like [Tautogolabrus adspersus]
MSPITPVKRHLIGEVAETAKAKYRLLEQRDKILRQGRPKRTDLVLSNVFVGTCPDMCPEKERESSDSPKDCTSIICRHVPLNLNKREILRRHFSRFGKVTKVICWTGSNTAIIHFDDHLGRLRDRRVYCETVAACPCDKGGRPSAGKEEAEGESLEDTGSKASLSPLRRPAFRAPAVSSTATLSRSSPVKKSTLAKSLQFDTEAPRESGSEASISDRPVPSSLLHLIGQVAETADAKYRLLGQRDKILRQGRPKRTDLVLSKVFVGTCPDMCPEKERYMRETRKQLSVFEVVPDTEMVPVRN